MDAKLIIEVTIKSVCNPEDLGHMNMTFPELTRDLIKEEGHFIGFIQDNWKILSVEEIK